MTELTLRIDGMSCDHCVRRVTKALEGALASGAAGAAAASGAAGGGSVGRVRQVSVGSATVDYDGRPESIDAIVQALDRIGYTARPESEVTKPEGART